MRIWERRKPSIVLLVALVAISTAVGQFEPARPRSEPSLVTTLSKWESVSDQVDLKVDRVTDLVGCVELSAQPKSPYLFFWTLPDCSCCLTRMNREDAQAAEMARAAGVQPVTILVGVDPEARQRFAKNHPPPTETVFSDETGEMAKANLGLDPCNCWVLLSEGGHILYRGGTDVEALREALRSLDT